MKFIIASILLFSIVFAQTSTKLDNQSLTVLTKEEKDWIKTHTVKVGVEQWTPVVFSNNGKDIDGIGGDFTKEIVKRTGLKIEIVNDEWNTLLKDFRDKKLDILPATYYTDKRAEFGLYSDAYFKMIDAVYTKSSDMTINSLKNLEGKTLAIVKGYGTIDKLQEKFPKIQLVFTKDLDDSINRVLNGKVTAFYEGQIAAQAKIKSELISGLKHIVVKEFKAPTLHFFSKIDEPILQSIIQKALKSLTYQDKQYIVNRWATIKVQQKSDWMLIGKISIGISLIILFILWNNYKLKSKIKEKTADIENQKNELESLVSSFDKNVIFSRTDLKGNITHVSEAFCQISGYKKEELLGKPHNVVRHPDMPSSTFKEIWNSLNSGCAIKVEVKNLRKDGSYYWVESKFEPDYDLDGNYIGYSALRVDITDKKEVEELSDNLEKKIEERTKDLLITKKEIEKMHKHTRESIEYAALIQSTLIPDNEKFRKYFKEYFAIWHPKDLVGGDIYLFEELRHDDECLLMVIDCTGHGVPGAFVTMLVKAIERQIVSQINNSDEVVSPANLLGVFNRSMKNLLKQEDNSSISNAGFDGQIMYYNKKDKIVKIASARNEIFYYQDDELKVIKGDRHSVGYKDSDANYKFTEHIIDVSKETTIYMSSDGFWDQNGGEKNFPFGKKRLKKMLDEIHMESMADQQEEFIYQFEDYRNGFEKNDDVTVIGLRI